MLVFTSNHQLSKGALAILPNFSISIVEPKFKHDMTRKPSHGISTGYPWNVPTNDFDDHKNSGISWMIRAMVDK